MNANIIEVLAEIEKYGREHDARETEDSRKMRNLDPTTARLAHIFAWSSSAKFILEIGTSNGYSTIWLASAAAKNGGRVVSIDQSADKHAMARENLRRASLLESVELLLGKAGTMVQELTGPFDLVFFDADRINSAENLQVLLPKLTPSVLLLADNALSHPGEIAPYLAAVEKLGGFEHVVVPVGNGLSVAYRAAM
jgi:predicted O-methyltransferase YrrM